LGISLKKTGAITAQYPGNGKGKIVSASGTQLAVVS